MWRSLVARPLWERKVVGSNPAIPTIVEGSGLVRDSGQAADAAAPPRPAYLDPRLVALVALGGAFGSLARYGVAQAFPPRGGWPVATLAVNLVGAFCLGLLLETLASGGPETRRGLRLRLALGTGVLGGFTTFSSLAIEVERLWADGRVALGLAYGLLSLVAGAALAGAGSAVGGRRRGAGSRA